MLWHKLPVGRDMPESRPPAMGGRNANGRHCLKITGYSHRCGCASVAPRACLTRKDHPTPDLRAQVDTEVESPKK
jgi:hypothetical protein